MFGGRGFNQLLAAALGVGCFLLWSAFGLTSAVLLPAILLWLYLYALLLIVEWLILLPVGRRPVLPLGPRAPLSRGAVCALVVCVAVFTAGREGALPWTTEIRVWTTYGEDDTTTSGLGPPDWVKGRPISCSIACTPAGAMCDALTATVACDKPGGDAVALAATVDLDVDAACHTPLFKLANGLFVARVTVSRAGSSHKVTVSGGLRLGAFGVGSCRDFRTLLGAQAAAVIMRELHEHIAGL